MKALDKLSLAERRIDNNGTDEERKSRATELLLLIVMNDRRFYRTNEFTASDMTRYSSCTIGPISAAVKTGHLPPPRTSPQLSKDLAQSPFV